MEEVAPIAREEAKLAHKVVVDLAKDIDNKAHVIIMDNHFCCIEFFENYLKRGFMSSAPYS